MKEFMHRLFCAHRYIHFHTIHRDTPPAFMYCLWCPKCDKYKIATVLLRY